MNKKIILYGIGTAVLIGIVAVIATSGNNNRTQYSASTLRVVEDGVFDFGTVMMQEGAVSHVFELRNDGAESVTITKVYTSCMCTVARITNEAGEERGPFGMPGHGLSSGTDLEIAHGSSATVEAVFDPAAHGPSGVGLAQRSIYLETNSAQSPKLELRFQAMVAR